MKLKAQFTKESTLQIEGDFIVTDPCYWLGRSDKFWNEFIDYMFPEDWTVRDEHKFGKIKTMYGDILWSSTAHGDGGYDATFGWQEGNYGVDAGMFCVASRKTFDMICALLDVPPIPPHCIAYFENAGPPALFEVADYSRGVMYVDGEVFSDTHLWADED